MEVLESEVDADGGKVALLELIVCESTEEGTFTDWAVTHDNYFEQVVVLPYHD